MFGFMFCKLEPMMIQAALAWSSCSGKSADYRIMQCYRLVEFCARQAGWFTDDADEDSTEPAIQTARAVQLSTATSNTTCHAFYRVCWVLFGANLLRYI